MQTTKNKNPGGRKPANHFDGKQRPWLHREYAHESLDTVVCFLRTKSCAFTIRNHHCLAYAGHFKNAEQTICVFSAELKSYCEPGKLTVV